MKPSVTLKFAPLTLNSQLSNPSHIKNDSAENKSLFRTAKYVAKKMDEKKFIETQISNLRDSLKPNDTAGEKLKESHISGLTNLRDNISEVKETPLSKSVLTQEKDRIDVLDSDALSRNIFFHKELMNIHFNNKEDGPRFTESGKVLKHSILGKSEWFLRLHNKQGGSIKEEDDRKDGNNLDSRRPSRPKTSNPSSYRAEPNIKSQHMRRMTNEGRPISALQFHSTHNDSINQHHNSLNRSKEEGVRIKSSLKFAGNKPKMETTLNEEELIKEYQAILSRKREAKIQDDQAIAKLPHADRTFLTRAERILAKYESRERGFLDFCDDLSRNLNRKPEDLIMMKIEGNRPLIETKETLELLKSGEERYGKDFWIKFLRKFPAEEKIIFEKEKKCLEHVSEQASVLNRPHSAITTIRKPYIKLKSKRPKSSERVHQEYEKIFKENEEKLEDIRAFVNNVDDLVVKGNNKLDSEFKYALKIVKKFAKDNKHKVYLRKKESNVKKIDEIFAEEYKFKEITKETGGIGFPKLKLNY